MPLAFICVKLPDGTLVHLDVELKIRVEELRSILAPKSGIKRHRQRLVFAGRLLQDGRSLEAYGIERNSTIHLLYAQTSGGEGPQGVDISAMPPQLAALQRHVLQNPDILQQMLESPAMQSLLNDHDFMRSLLKTDPRLGALLEGCPELSEMLHDKEFMKQSTEALRNPVHVRDVLRSTDRAMAQVDSLGGGSFDVLRQVCEDITRPNEDPDYDPNCITMKKQEKAKEARRKAMHAKPGEEEEEEEEEGAKKEEHELPEWVGTFDTNAMASMLQDQNMQHLMCQLIQTLPGPMVKLHPDDPFVDSGFLGQLFHAQTLDSMVHLQDAVGKLSMTADVDPAAGATGGSAKAKAKAAPRSQEKDSQLLQDSPAALSGLHPQSPAANFKDAFALFLAAEAESPEVRYKGQLQAMQNMGFTDREACIQALHSCDGNMNRAVDHLMKLAKQ